MTARPGAVSAQAVGQLDRAAIAISARLDSLPGAAPIWMLVALLSAGSFCEIYDLSLTAYFSPGLVKAGVFKAGAAGLFGLSDAASFIAATFAGLWLGALAFSSASDRWGRLPAMRYSLVWYSACSCLMGVQSSAVGVDALRFLTGLGLGVQVIAIDCFIAEVVPKALRGRAFALSTAIQFCATPLAAVMALILLPKTPLGIAGWRWLAFAPAAIAIVVLLLQRKLTESPRWLVQKGRTAEADRAVQVLEDRVRGAGASASALVRTAEEAQLAKPERELGRAEFGRRLFMMASANFLTAIGYFGFLNWVPSLLQAKGADLSHSLAYSAAIALSFPIAPLVFIVFADRFERKHQLMLGAVSAAVFGLLFARQTTPLMWIIFGVLVTVSSNLMAFAIHAYQSEIFTTRTRSRAVGFVYSFTRLSTIFSGYLIAFLLHRSGVGSVFTLVDGALLAGALVIGLLGPRTRGRALEQIA